MASTVYSYDWLCNAMRSREVVSIISAGKTHTGTINGIRLDDGSGRHFLVNVVGYSQWLHVRAE